MSRSWSIGDGGWWLVVIMSLPKSLRIVQTYSSAGSDGLNLGRRFNAGIACVRNPRVAAATVECSGELTTISTVAPRLDNHSPPQPALKRRPKFKPSLRDEEGPPL